MGGGREDKSRRLHSEAEFSNKEAKEETRRRRRKHKLEQTEGSGKEKEEEGERDNSSNNKMKVIISSSRLSLHSAGTWVFLCSLHCMRLPGTCWAICKACGIEAFQGHAQKWLHFIVEDFVLCCILRVARIKPCCNCFCASQRRRRRGRRRRRNKRKGECIKACLICVKHCVAATFCLGLCNFGLAVLT